jgi:NCAIR mutase (PurE)-related protein
VLLAAGYVAVNVAAGFAAVMLATNLVRRARLTG